MIQRLALFAASLAAAAVLAVGLALAGVGRPGGPDAASAPVTQPAAATAVAPAEPAVQVDTVYVAPQPSPQEITVTKTARATGGAAEAGNEGEDD